MPRIVIIGEAWGEQEELEGRPFVGPSGKLLHSLLRKVGIDSRDCLLTNVFNFRPKPSNDIQNLCGPKAGGIPNMPALTKGKYARTEFLPELRRLHKEILDAEPNLIIALGATASWACLRSTGIRKIRGTTAWSTTLPRAVKVLPTYHPAAVLREYSLYPIVFADLTKARRESSFREVRRPRREVWINPTIEDLYEFERRYITPYNLVRRGDGPSEGTHSWSELPALSIDVETMGDRITCFGVSPSKSTSLVIPFILKGDRPSPYWKTLDEEIEAVKFMRHICALPNPKRGQNFLYDIRFLWEKYGIPIINFQDDSMLLHHSLQPEMEKGLGFLGSVYTDEASWKFMRTKDTIKTED